MYKYLIIFFFIIGCKGLNQLEYSHEQFESDKVNISLSDLKPKSIKYIPVVFDSTTVIGEISKCIFFNNICYFTDGYKDVYKFNIKDGITSKLRTKGHEITWIQSIVPTKAGIFLLDGESKIQKFNLDGNFVCTYQIDINGITEMVAYKNGLLINQEYEQKLRGFHLNYTGELLDSITLNSNLNHLNFTKSSILFSHKNLLWFKEQLNDTVFNYPSKIKKSFLSIDYVDNRLNDTIFPKKHTNYMKQFEDEILQQDLCIVKSNLFSIYYYNKVLYGFVYSLRNDSLLGRFNYSEGISNDIDAGLNFRPMFFPEDKKVAMFVSAKDLNDYIESDEFEQRNAQLPNKKMS